jgi:hypothetical protein
MPGSDLNFKDIIIKPIENINAALLKKAFAYETNIAGPVKAYISLDADKIQPL